MLIYDNDLVLVEGGGGGGGGTASSHSVTLLRGDNHIALLTNYL